MYAYVWPYQVLDMDLNMSLVEFKGRRLYCANLLHLTIKAYQFYTQYMAIRGCFLSGETLRNHNVVD
jgi:hypothetical protein